ncbi:autotransporter domain-containing protein [Sphingomonas sp. So64.6b]|uniref:autotransporter domain-containing protein n=1 Tax=Sphingomonas sp. So64.6b TaxID=2997354 RepID=UPI0016038904|nr:autotransporter domain-containing protein [Sphingomonas sp. So64.6b]QNA84498.1 autotransporter domain-containing protein [Sphingomonas sp. So64.6b]
MSRLAALAASVSFAAMAAPAYAQCVEGPPNTFTCSGQTNVPQIITADDATVTTNPGFEVDTSNNGNGIALQVSGAGLISFEGSPDLTGAGARFSTTGSSGLSAGELSIFSNGNIFANGANGLRLDNAGGGDTTAVWVGSINNIAGNGVYAGSAFGAGDLSLIVDDVAARDDGIWAQYGANGSVTITAVGPVTGHTGAGLRINAGAAADDIDVTVGDVTGGSWGIIIDSQGSDTVKVDASGVVTGLGEAGIAVVAGTNTTGIDIRANQVEGAVAGIQTDNQGVGNTVIAATGPVTGDGYGIFAVNGASAQGISIAATDVSGFYGIRSFNQGTGATAIAATGFVSGGDFGIIAQNMGGSTDLTIQAGDVSAAGYGIEAENSGSGTTTIVAGNVTGQNKSGIRVLADMSAGSVDLTVGNATGGEFGIVVGNSGIGSVLVNATGTVTGLSDRGISVTNSVGTTDIEIHANNVNGGYFAGIQALNNGTGNTTIEATGMVATSDLYGIVAVNAATSKNLSVTALDVVGAYGISASNFGTGATEIVSTGTVIGFSADGLRVGNTPTATDLRVDVNVVQGDERGMRVLNDGTGSTSIRASGTVTGFTLNGIEAEIGLGAQGITIDAVDVTGGISGVDLVNYGQGTTVVHVTGALTGHADSGLHIITGTGAQDVSVAVAQVTGSIAGVSIEHDGTGSVGVNATGPVSAAAPDGFGIVVRAGGGASDLRIGAVDVAGGYAGIDATNQGSGLIAIDATGSVTGGAYGILARNEASATDIAVRAVTVTGTGDGIAAQNLGSGTTTVVANSAAGANGTGVRVDASGAAGAVDLAIGDASGGDYGVLVTNFGTSTTTVETTGMVSGIAEGGIAIENGGATTGIELHAAQVSGETYGIAVQNSGTGNTAVFASGLVNGIGGGMIVRNDATASNILIDAAAVQGGTTGILAVNQGIGTTWVRTAGAVTGGSVAGIDVRADVSALDVTVDTAEVSGGNGITVQNFGHGSASVNASGTVTGTNATGTGIAMVGGTGSTDLRVAAVSVAGGTRGISTVNGGSGETFIATTGLVSGGEFGIRAENGIAATDLTIRATDVQSNGNAIFVEALGTGDTSVVTTGTVVSHAKEGILVFGGTSAGDITVEAGNVSGGLSGISTINYGLGDTRITVSGVVQGSARGVEAASDGNQGVVIVNNGTIRNASGLGSSRAVSASGGSVGIANTATLTGTVEIAGDSSVLLNLGNWQSIGGISNFATVDDQLFNGATGTIVGGTLAAVAQATIWQGLERFQNQGVLRLQDGGTGDVIQTSAATTFTNGSVLSVDIAGLNAADSFRTTGKVTIEAGSRLQAATTQPLVLHGKHVVVQADGGLTGQFAFEDQFLTAFAGLRDGYTATSAFIEFAQMRSLDSAGLTPNQKAAAAGADSLPDGNVVKDALLLLPNDAAAQAAFDQLSGEIHPSARNSMVEDSRLVRNAVLDRLVDGEPGTDVWGRIFGTSGISDGDYNAAELDRDTKGGVIGVDRSIGSVTVGLAGGWSDTTLRIARRDSSGSIKGIHGMVYAGGRFGQFGLRGGVGYARTSTETMRHIAFPGFSASPTADYHGSVLQGFVEAGYRVPVGGGHVEPFASLTAIRAKTDAFTEANGPAALSGAAISEKTMSSTLGARFETSPAGAFSLRGTAGWRHGWGDLDPVGRHAFAGGAPFTVLGTAGSKNAGVFDAEARYRLSPKVTLSIGYNGVLGAGNADHAITGAFKIVF